MSHFTWVRIFFAGVATITFLPIQGLVEAKTESSFKKEVVPFFEEYCIRCHGPEKSKGQISLHTPGLLGPRDHENAGASRSKWCG